MKTSRLADCLLWFFMKPKFTNLKWHHTKRACISRIFCAPLQVKTKSHLRWQCQRMASNPFAIGRLLGRLCDTFTQPVAGWTVRSGPPLPSPFQVKLLQMQCCIAWKLGNCAMDCWQLLIFEDRSQSQSLQSLFRLYWATFQVLPWTVWVLHAACRDLKSQVSESGLWQGCWYSLLSCSSWLSNLDCI